MAWLAFWLPASVAGVLAAGIIAGSIAEEHGLIPIAAARQRIDRAVEWAGLGIRQVSVSGLRYATDADVYTALGLDGSRTILGFDSRNAVRRIEGLPWVDKATITRVFPDGLDVRIVERRPIATVAADAMPGLPRVAGEGAERGAQALLEKLAQYPVLETRVQAAERQGSGRWSLQLKHGGAVHLPLENEGEAIARAAVLVASGLADKGDIDLREGAKMPVRLKRSAGGNAAPSTAPKSAGRT